MFIIVYGHTHAGTDDRQQTNHNGSP